MTIAEHIERSSFAYDPQFPPDIAEGLPLTAAIPRREHPRTPLRRALRGCVRLAASAARRR